MGRNTSARFSVHDSLFTCSPWPPARSMETHSHRDMGRDAPCLDLSVPIERKDTWRHASSSQCEYSGVLEFTISLNGQMPLL